MGWSIPHLRRGTGGSSNYCGIILPRRVGATVLERKVNSLVKSTKNNCDFHFKIELLPQVEVFKYLRIFFTSEGRVKCQIDRRAVAVKRELSIKVMLSIYRSVYAPTLPFWFQALWWNRKSEDMDTSKGNKFPSKSGWPLP